MAKNETYNLLIHTSRWLRLRRYMLTEHPLCQQCEKEGIVSAATEVHHIVPCETAANAREMETLMYDPHNLMALCHRCHVEMHVKAGKGGKEERRRRADSRLGDFERKFFGTPGGDFLRGGGGR